jgi:hypothetical protein
MRGSPLPVSSGSHATQRPDSGFTLAPIETGDGLVRLHVAIDRSSGDAARPFVTVAETLDALGLLGALADGRTAPVRWVVIWIAKSPSVFLGGDSLDGPSSNVDFERRWNASWRAWDGSNDASYAILHANPTTPAPILLLSTDGQAPRPLTAGRDPTPLALCTDDGLLEANELPAFSRSTVRFLVSRPAHGAPKFYWLSGGDAPLTGTTAVMDLMRDHPGRVLFNAGVGLLGGGPIRVTPYHPVQYVDLAAMLHGEAPRPGPRGTESVALPGGSELLNAWAGAAKLRTRPSDAGRLFGSLDGAEPRNLEATCLRLRAVRDMIAAVREATERGRQPLFNLAAESFVADIDCLAEGLPFLWQTRVRLARPGVARTFTLDADPPLRLFSRPPSTGLDSLVPTEPAVAFLAEALLLDVADAGAGSIALKVQLVPRQPISIAQTDLLRFHLRVGDKQIPILARPLRAMTGRQPFEARSMPFVPPADRPMRAGAQVSMLVETIPLEGSPHDLYALFILACRMLLAGGHPTVLATVSEVEEASTIAALRDAIGADGTREAPEHGPLYGRAADFPKVLRPAPLSQGDGTPESWPKGLTTELWSDVLRAIATLRHGWPGCPCRDLAHFDPEDPARVFDAPLAAFETLVRQARTCLLGQRAIDAEIRAVALELAALAKARPAAARP